MAEINEKQILEALSGVKDPDTGEDIVSAGMVAGVQLKDGHVAFAIEVDPARGAQLEPLRKEAALFPRARRGAREKAVRRESRVGAARVSASIAAKFQSTPAALVLPSSLPSRSSCTNGRIAPALAISTLLS